MASLMTVHVKRMRSTIVMYGWRARAHHNAIAGMSPPRVHKHQRLCQCSDALGQIDRPSKSLLSRTFGAYVSRCRLWGNVWMAKCMENALSQSRALYERPLGACASIALAFDLGHLSPVPTHARLQTGEGQAGTVVWTWPCRGLPRSGANECPHECTQDCTHECM